MQGCPGGRVADGADHVPPAGGKLGDDRVTESARGPDDEGGLHGRSLRSSALRVFPLGRRARSCGRRICRIASMTGASMAESVTVQPDDVRLIRALQIAPRASFASIAAALGVTENAVGRRYRRLRAEGVLRVAGIVDPGALGQSKWLVRLRCRPGSVGAIADALAKRDDVSWVGLCAGGSEIGFAVRSRTREQRDDLLGQQLPRTAAVLDIHASAMLRQFVGGRGHYWAALRGTLTPEQEALLGTGEPPFTEAPVVA